MMETTPASNMLKPNSTSSMLTPTPEDTARRRSQNPIQIVVVSVVPSEMQRGRFDIGVKLSAGVNGFDEAENRKDGREETQNFVVFLYFLKRGPFLGLLPAIGEFLNTEEYEALVFADACTRATLKAADFLAYGDNTEKQLYEKLCRKGFPKEACAAAVGFCVEKRYIDEEDQLRRFMEMLCTRKKYGLRRIKQEIYQKGFSDRAVKAVFSDMAQTLDFDSAARSRVKKLGADAFSAPDKKKRATASLLRLGFSYNEIQRAVKAVFGNGSDWEASEEDACSDEDMFSQE